MKKTKTNIFLKHKFSSFLGFAGSLIVLIMGFSSGIVNHNSNENVYQASIMMNSEKILKEESQLIKDLIRNNDLEYSGKIKNIKGGEKFLSVLKKFKEIINIEVNFSDEGLFVSFLANKNNSDSLHKYFGFFKFEDNQIIEIFWSENAKAKIIEKKADFIKVENTSVFSWKLDDIWKDYFSNKTILIESENDGKYIRPGEIAIIKNIDAEMENLTPQNTNVGYMIILSE
ncbi:MAG: hypothetical protein ACOC1P_02530 [Minisyncoccales bacterium]